MVTRINPSLPALWRDPKTLQIGYGAKAVQLGQLTLAQERLVAALFIGIADGQLGLIAAQTGNSEAETAALLSSLELAMIQDRDRNFQLSPELVSSMFAEISRANIEHAPSGNQLVAMRAMRKVFVNDLSAAGLLICQALASCGIGQIFSDDEERVLKSDLGPCGYPEQFLGRPRLSAVRDLIAASPNQSNVSRAPKSHESLDAAAILAQDVLSPASFQTWLSNDTPHVALVFEQDGLWFSGLVRPGLTPCLNCYLVQLRELDPAFVNLASQLLGKKSRLDDTSSRLFAAAIATRRLLQYLDSETTETSSEANGLRFSYRKPEIEKVFWQPAADCCCQLN